MKKLMIALVLILGSGSVANAQYYGGYGFGYGPRPIYVGPGRYRTNRYGHLYYDKGPRYPHYLRYSDRFYNDLYRNYRYGYGYGYGYGWRY